MRIKDVVRVKRTWHSDHYDRYWGCELQGEKGQIVGILLQNGELQGYRVRFPAITVWDDDNREKLVENFIWPFRKEDLEKVDGETKFAPRRKRHKARQLKDLIAAAKRLKKRGKKVKEIAEQLDAPMGTVKHWLYG